MKKRWEKGRQKTASAQQNNSVIATSREQEADGDNITIETMASTSATPSSEDDVPHIDQQSDSSDVELSSILSNSNSYTDDSLHQQHNSAHDAVVRPPPKRVAEIIRRDLWNKDETVVDRRSSISSTKLTHNSTDGMITFRNAIARNGGILAIVRAMEKQHAEHAGIGSCRALELLALDTLLELAIGEVGGIETILGAMMIHSTQVNLQDAAWSALCNCTCGNALDVMTTIDQQGEGHVDGCILYETTRPP
jgi:hypothetical protein